MGTYRRLVPRSQSAQLSVSFPLFSPIFGRAGLHDLGRFMHETIPRERQEGTGLATSFSGGNVSSVMVWGFCLQLLTLCCNGTVPGSM